MTEQILTRDAARRLDGVDPLREWREQFVIDDPELIYLDGNSLGMTPKRTIAAVREVVERQWATGLITSWWEEGWLDLPLTVGDTLAPLLGARPGEVAVHDSTTVCLFQLVNVAIDMVLSRNGTPRPIVVAYPDTEFPTDRYVAEGVARLRSAGGGHPVVARHGVADLSDVDVVLRSHVDYRTAEIAPLAEENARARAAGAVTVWDLSHAAGVVELDLEGAGVELAAGCTYKFLNGGPGAPAFTYVRSSIHDQLTQPIWGWFGQRDQFEMDNDFDPRPGAGRMLNGTPGILGLTAAHAGISVSAEAGIAAIADKASKLSRYAIELADRLGLRCTTAPPPVSSGGHVTINHPEATRLQAALAEQRVIVDKRDPDVLRFGLSPLTTRFIDVFDGLTLLGELTSGEHDEHRASGASG